MTPPCPAPASYRWAVLPADGDLPTAGVLVSESGVHLVIAREGETWAVYDAAGTIIRDGVRPERLPAAILAIVSPASKE